MNIDHLIIHTVASRHKTGMRCAGCGIFKDCLPKDEPMIELGGYEWCWWCADRRMADIPMWGTGGDVYFEERSNCCLEDFVVNYAGERYCLGCGGECKVLIKKYED